MMQKRWLTIALLCLCGALALGAAAGEESMALSALGEAFPKAYLEQAAKLTLQSGDYAQWPVEDKQRFFALMARYGLADAPSQAAPSEADIDACMLRRYGVSEQPGDLAPISLMRMAWVELGPYTAWPNETWVWFSHMMLDLGLWTENSDVDVYEVPGAEAIPPQEAVEIAREHAVEQARMTLREAQEAETVWHYMTQASDVLRERMNYCICFLIADERSVTVFVTPEGKAL